MNIVCLTGRLTKDPEIRYTQAQKPVASFSLAVDRDYKNENGERPSDFINCVVWGSSANFLEKYARKGVKIGVSGMIQSRKWQDQSGNNHYATEVNCAKVEILDFPKRRDEDAEPRPKRERKARSHDDGPGSGYEVYTPPGFEEMDDGGELPF